MRPKLTYTIWFSQRNGSSLLCEGLKSTGIAGKVEEHFHKSPDQRLIDLFQVPDYKTLQQKIWENGMTSNGVYGIKINAPRKEKDPIIEELKKIPAAPSDNPSNFGVWNAVFPNCKHIFLTRRNKVRQAVSWWKAIVSEEWHRIRKKSMPYSPEEIIGKYDFEAIKHLLIETILREARIQAFLEEGNVVPLTIVYEDFIKDYEATIRKVISFLDVEEMDYTIAQPYYEKLADEVSDVWVERFRVEIQKGWDNIIW